MTQNDPNAPSPTSHDAPLRSVHSTSVPGLLEWLGASLLVTTYQAGKLVILRSDGGVLNTHFRGFDRPMGLARAGDRLAIGTQLEVWDYQNVPAVARSLDPSGGLDACFLPRSGHVTGDIDIHEMAFRGGELWFVNTRFSCLCTRDDRHSFVPRWRPSFVSALAPEDRCHLNGLGVGPGDRFWVTALGATDTPGGWREGKRDGGVVIDGPSGEVIARGLSMPHSPRWHDGRLWLLESGTGRLGFLDEDRGRFEAVAGLPGFARGLDIVGGYAFVGLSQIRESAHFSGLPIREPGVERHCGVWVVELRTGGIVGFVRFEDALQEIFAVQAMAGLRFPDVVNDDRALIGDSFVLPDEAFERVPEGLRTPADRPAVCC
ncbi:TIGR03032 family protein [Tautonia sp. JC769]|uniref:TIGR03032 family protein n=1 Tax=Tautonia sp. JC769 TaxID=3232135 RepID=UPI003458D36E